jgi:hypothetical protein
MVQQCELVTNWVPSWVSQMVLDLEMYWVPDLEMYWVLDLEMYWVPDLEMLLEGQMAVNCTLLAHKQMLHQCNSLHQNFQNLEIQK